MSGKEVRGVAMLIAKYSPELGGAEKQARLLARLLEEKGIRVSILTRNYHRGPAREQIDLSMVYRTPTFGDHRVLNSLGYLIGCFIWLLRFRHSFDVIHCHQSYSPATAGVLAAWVLRKPVVVKITASNDYGEVGELKRLPFFQLRRRLLRRVCRFFVVNPDIVTELESLGIARERCAWIPNGVVVPEQAALDAATRTHMRRELGQNPDDQILLYTGRLSAEKGLIEVTEAVARLTRDFPNLRFWVVGEAGAQRSIEPELRALVDREKLSQVVRFTGRVDNVLPYLLAADLFVLASISEGMSNSLLEAMAAGLPCIATDIPATRAVLEKGREGLTVPVGSVDALAEAIGSLCAASSRARQLGEAARARVRREFSVEIVAEKVTAEYHRLFS
jgi:glycosyltransferase involved in cell wall biosynthesis